MTLKPEKLQQEEGPCRTQEDPPFPLGKAFVCAFTGIIRTFKTQRNMRIHLAVAIVALIIGFLLGLSPFAWALIIICIVIVLAAECLNTAVEEVVDMVSPEYSLPAKWAKDAAAAAVLICAFGAVIIGILVFGSALLARLGIF